MLILTITTLTGTAVFISSHLSLIYRRCDVIFRLYQVRAVA